MVLDGQACILFRWDPRWTMRFIRQMGVQVTSALSLEPGPASSVQSGKRWAAKVIAIGLLLLAVGIRVNYVVPVLLSGVPMSGDALYRYHALAQNLVAGNGFTSDPAPPYHPNSFAQPGYPAFVALLYWPTGGSQKAVVLAQLVLELLTLFIVFELCGSLKLDRLVQVTAVAIGASCPILVSYSTFVLSEVLGTFLVTLTCWMLVSALGDEIGRRRRWVFAGLAGGSCLLVRPDLLVAVALTALAAGIYLVRRESWAQAAVAMGLLSMAMIAILLPWTLRGLIVFGRFQPLGEVAARTRLGYARWLDTWIDNPRDQTTFGGEWDKAVSVPLDKLDDPEEWATANQAYDLVSQRGFYDPEASEKYTTLARDAIQKRPFKRLIGVPLIRAARTWADMPFGGIGLPQRRPAIALTFLYWWLLTGCMLMGIALMSFLKRAPLGVLLALLIGRLLLPIISSYGAEARYLIEALPACFIFAAAAVVSLTRLTEKRLIRARASG
jgi:hypothetical protein